MEQSPNYRKRTRAAFLEPRRRFRALIAAIGVACLLAAGSGGEVESQASECFSIPAHHTNDTDAIANAIRDHSCVQFKANTTYWIDGRVIPVPAHRTILGGPGNAIKLRSYGPSDDKCQVVGPHGHAQTRHRHCAAYFLFNATDASGIVIDGLNVDGRRGELRYGTRYPGGTAINFKRLDGGRAKGVRIRNTKILNWPGVSIYSSAFDDLELRNVRSRNSGRGGIVIASSMHNREGQTRQTTSTRVRFVNVSSTGTGDDALAMAGVSGFMVRNSVGSTRDAGPVEAANGKTTLYGAGLALRNVEGTNTQPNVVGFETTNSHNSGIYVRRDPEMAGPHPDNIFVTDSYVAGSNRNGILVEVRRGAPYSDNIRIESNRRIHGARSVAAVRFSNPSGTGKANIAPSTYRNNVNLDSPTLACERITGVTGGNGSC